MSTTWTVPATITRAVDGDTLAGLLDLGWKISLDAKIRLTGINCPEIDTPEGLVARTYTFNWLNAAMKVGEAVGGPLAAPVTVVSHSLDKYGRVLGDVYALRADAPKGLKLPEFDDAVWRHLNADLLAAGHAVVMR